MKLNQFSLFSFVICIMVVGCGEDEDNNVSGPALQCDTLGIEACRKLETCTNADFNRCFSDYSASGPSCSTATSVRSNFSQCIADIQAASCQLVQANPDTLPPSCTPFPITF